MSLTRLANICSHLQNASKARLGLTSIPSTNMSLSLSLALLHSGFLSTVTRGGPSPPLLLTSTSLPHSTSPDALTPNHPDSAIVTQSNIATRRLWLGLKYWNNYPVIKEMTLISKPKQRITLGFRDLAVIVRGREAKWVKGLTRPGECLFVSTDVGILEARVCVEKQLGGMALCRVV